MIGLRRHTVQVVDHDPAWADLAADACRRIREAGGDLMVDTQHVGSTAVPDLPAKHILDLAAAVATLGFPTTGNRTRTPSAISSLEC